MRYIPHGYLLGTQSRPTQICLYGITDGADRWLKISFDPCSPPVTFVSQALEIARRTPRVPFHGDLQGFVINYARDRAVVFDPEGNPVEQLVQEFVPSPVKLMVDGREIQGGWW